MKQRHFWKMGHLLLTLSGAAWIAIVPAHAAGPVAGYPSYQKTGKVDGINLAENQITVTDRVYVLAKDITILSGNKVVPKESLKQGMRLGFNSNMDQFPYVISAIWILSAQ